MEWKIYYGNGTTFSDEDGSVEDAPTVDVQIIVYQHPVIGKTILRGKDYYIYSQGHWIGLDEFGMVDQLLDMGLMRMVGWSPKVVLELFLVTIKPYGIWWPIEKPEFYFNVLNLGFVKAGRWIHRDTFTAIHEKALNDSFIPDVAQLPAAIVSD